MKTEILKLRELDFNIIITIGVIESDEMLTEIFKDEIKMPFNILYRLAKEDKLNEKTKTLITSIFDKIILTKREYIDKYLRLANEDGITINENTIEIESIEDVEEEVEVVDIVEVKKPRVKKEKTGKELPKWYGKEKITADIKRQKGSATPVQKAMLKLNDMKNIYSKLSARGIKSMLADEDTLTDEECRKIESVIILAERQLKEILNKRK